MDLSPEAILYMVLGFAWLEFGWEAYLGRRQRRIYRTCTRPPPELAGIMDDETFEKSRLYALDRANFGAVQGLFEQLLSTALIWFMAFKHVWDFSGRVNEWVGLGSESEVWRSMTFQLTFDLISTAVHQPFAIYETFVLEERHGFNQQTAWFFVKDRVKSFAVSHAIMLPIMAAVIQIIRWGGDYFFVYLWAFVSAFALFMLVVYPEVIAPLFDKYTPLPEGDLRAQIEDLAASVQFPLYKLFVVEGSKRSSHSNAYFYGFFRFKRIVLFDTLLEEAERGKLKAAEEAKNDCDDRTKEVKDNDCAKEAKAKKTGCTAPEILAVLGHELGHWKLNHTTKNMVISEVHIFMMFALFGYLYRQPTLYAALGFVDEQPVLMGLMIILQFVLAPYNALLNFGMTALSRRFEFQADDFAATSLGRGPKLCDALIKLSNDNLSYPIHDWLYSTWHHSHPPLLERLAAIRQKSIKAD